MKEEGRNEGEGYEGKEERERDYFLLSLYLRGTSEREGGPSGLPQLLVIGVNLLQ